MVRVQSIADVDGQKIAPFLAATEAALRAHPPCAVILDMRGDSGGDYAKTWRFAHVLPRLLAPTGHIFILTDPLTFSAAITPPLLSRKRGAIGSPSLVNRCVTGCGFSPRAAKLACRT